MSETTNVAQIRLDLGSDPDVRLFRFQCGEYELANGRGYITVGVPGMSDLLGWRTVLITPEMVGRWLPVFSAIEVKRLGGRTQKKRLELQKSFLAQVQAHGGLSGFAFDAIGARQILNQAPGVVEFPG